MSSKEFTGARQLRGRGGGGGGERGFDDLLSILDTLVQYGANETVIAELKDNLKYLKQYMKSDYKVKEYKVPI